LNVPKCLSIPRSAGTFVLSGRDAMRVSAFTIQLDEFEVELAAHSRGGFGESVKRYRVVFGIK